MLSKYSRIDYRENIEEALLKTGWLGTFQICWKAKILILRKSNKSQRGHEKHVHRQSIAKQ